MVTCSKRYNVVNFCKFTACFRGELTKFHRIHLISPQNYVQNLLWKKQFFAAYLIYFSIFSRLGKERSNKVFIWLYLFIGLIISTDVLRDKRYNLQFHLQGDVFQERCKVRTRNYAHHLSDATLLWCVEWINSPFKVFFGQVQHQYC